MHPHSRPQAPALHPPCPPPPASTTGRGLTECLVRSAQRVPRWRAHLMPRDSTSHHTPLFLVLSLKHFIAPTLFPFRVAHPMPRASVTVSFLSRSSYGSKGGCSGDLQTAHGLAQSLDSKTQATRSHSLSMERAPPLNPLVPHFTGGPRPDTGNGTG